MHAHTPASSTRITSDAWGTLPDGSAVTAYTLQRGTIRLCAITFGGIVTELQVPDRHSQAGNVVLGFDNLHDYATRNPNFGVIVGRYANRIAGAQFELDGRLHTLDRNNGPNCLHGGAQGFAKRLWRAEVEAGDAETGATLALHYRSADGEEGFPGEMQVCVRYSLGADCSWRLDYEARCDRPTVVNLSHHDYFNLGGSGSALGQRLQILASRYTEVDATLIPTRIAAVEGTPFDFRAPTVIAARLQQAHPQLLHGRGYDHNWLLDGADAEGVAAGALHRAARLEDPASGRVLEIDTSEPGLQFYSGNFLDGSLHGPDGQPHARGNGVCLETQHYPDSPHHPAWPSTVLRPGRVWRSRTVHRFGTC